MGAHKLELQNININDLKNISSKHAVVIVSNGKIKLVPLPKYGNLKINCSDGIAKHVEEITGTKF